MSRDLVHVRDSKLEPSPVLAFPRDMWQAFVADVRAGVIG